MAAELRNRTMVGYSRQIGPGVMFIDEYQQKDDKGVKPPEDKQFLRVVISKNPSQRKKTGASAPVFFQPTETVTPLAVILERHCTSTL